MRVYAGQPVPEGMSKGEFKRQVKRQRMEDTREAFVEARREKRRAAHRRQRQARRALPAVVQEPSGVRVVLDCGFDDLMQPGERVSLASQLTRCYSENRHAARPVELVVSSFNKRLRQRFDEDMGATHERWQGVEFCDGDFDPAPTAVYLTGDADTTLAELEPGHTYVVGGIVDHNRYKNLCLDKARRLGVRVARLPIDEHIRVSGRRVLTTNQAFELLLRWLELRDWKAAFEAVIPPRKLGDEKEEGQRDSLEGLRSEDLQLSESQEEPTGTQELGGSEEPAEEDLEQPIEDSEQSVKESKHPFAESRQPIGNSKQVFADSKQAVGDSKQAVGDSKQAVGDSKQAVGDSNQAVGDSKPAVGDSQ